MQDLFTSFDLTDGVRLHVFPTQKLKSTQVRVYLRRPMRADEAAANALIPMVLRRGTRRLSTQQAIFRHLESLFGTGFSVDVGKMGETQFVEFALDIPASRFVPGGERLLDEGIGFLGELLSDPALENGGFRTEPFNVEREVLRQRIEGLIDQRFQYAVQRLFEHMCAGEPFATYKYGKAADLDGITPASLYAQYLRLRDESPVEILAVGPVEPKAMRDSVSKSFSLGGRTANVPAVAAGSAGRDEPQSAEDRLDVLQGILVLGYRTGVRYADDAYPALVMYNGVLGGYAHSKLFMNVRERASLAYSAFSFLEPTKGVQALFAGIDPKQRQRAEEIVLAQVEAMRRGEISEDEMEATRRSLINDSLSMEDDAGSLMRQRLTGLVNGRIRTPAQMRAAYEKVTRDDVVQIAQTVQLDTIYFLRDRKEAGGR